MSKHIASNAPAPRDPHCMTIGRLDPPILFWQLVASENPGVSLSADSDTFEVIYCVRC